MDIPSLFMIPSAVSSGKVHSVFPNSTDADFDFNRDSSATRVNSQGLIETVGYFGSELITNGGFDTDSNWNKGTGWSIANGKASFDGGADAALTQSNVVQPSTLYKVLFTVSDRTTGSLQLRLGNSGVVDVTVNSNNDFSFDLTTDSSGTSVYFRAIGGFDGSIDNVSVKQITGDRARLNYEIEGGLVNTKPSLLLEPQSTNLITYSQDISQLTNGNLTINSNSVISPDGTMNAARVIPTTNSAQHRFTPNTTVSTSTVYTASIFAKADGYNRIRLAENATTGGDARFDLQNGTILTTNGVTAKIEAFPNDWFRCSITETTASTSFRFDVIVMDDSSNSTFAGDGYSGVQLWGYQLEQLSYPTSYIPTNGSTQTRAAETCNGAGTSSIFESTEGILYCEIKALANDGTNRYISLNDGTTSNRVNLFYDTNNVLRGFITGISSMPTTATITNFNKVALKYKSGNIALFVNGVEVATKTDSISLSGLNSLAFDQTGGLNFYGKIRDIRVYNTKEMTNSEVDILLTKITS